MTVIGVLNPQEPLPSIDSKYAAVEGMEVPIDLDEDSWTVDYFILFFHSGAHDPVATSILKSLVKKQKLLECKVVGVSIDTTTTLFDWLDSEPELAECKVPLISDKAQTISRQLGVLLQESGQDHTGAGFSANSVFIIDHVDRVRYHCVLDSRVAFNIEEVVRVMRALRTTDGGGKLAMAGFSKENDAVNNEIRAIENFYGRKYGGEVDDNVEEIQPTTDADEKVIKENDEVNQAISPSLNQDKEGIKNDESKENGGNADDEREEKNEIAVKENVSKETAKDKKNYDGDIEEN